jgi:hypothetical protein
MFFVNHNQSIRMEIRYALPSAEAAVTVREIGSKLFLLAEDIF